MLESVAAVATFGAVLLLIGACTASWLIGGLLSADATAAARIRQWALRAAALLMLALLVRLLAHTLATFDTLDLDGLRIVGFESRWGGGWRLQVLASAAAAAVAWVHARRSGRGSLLALSACAAALCYALPLSGHAAAVPWHHGAASLHLLGGGAWVGTLAALRLGSRRTSHAGHVHGAVAPADAGTQIFRRFSPVAMAGASLAVATGVMLAFAFLGSPWLLLTESYGRLLAVKLALFAGVCVCGAINWRLVGAGRPPRAAGWELALAAAIVVVTGLLTETAHP